MTTPVTINFKETNLDDIATATGRIAVFVAEDGALDATARRLNRLTKGALARFAASDTFEKMKPGEAKLLAFPAGVEAEGVVAVRLGRRPDTKLARKAGVAIARLKGAGRLLVLGGKIARAEEISFGIALRDYEFDVYRTEEKTRGGTVTMMVSKPEAVARAATPLAAVAEGVFFTRDLISEPANVLTTDDFAARLAAMQEIGLDVEILEEAELARLGMRTLLAVGQGSDSPSKVVIMRWNGGDKDEKPFALVGKGVVFDTGGISLKPGLGMEEMTMDMGGAGVVAGVMRALALRGAKCNVVGLVGIVENMPSGNATRPGDVIRSMKGDTIEVINTDAEGRLVLADVLWYAQERFQPRGMINLATLTGAIIIGLGHENAGVFSNDDGLCNAFLKAAEAEGEGAWRMPLSPAYDKLLKSRIADMRNSCGRPAGAISAAQFLKRFVKDDMPWIHLDIAGVAYVGKETPHAPKGASGWGVMALTRLMDEL